MHCKKSSCISPTAATIGGNDDLLSEILLFLPAKSLVRFKLVNKRWRSLISAPSFSRLHVLHHSRRRPQHQHSFILGRAESQFFVCDPSIRRLIPFRFPFPFVLILQSCNGLFLLRCKNTPHGRKYYCVFNPTTMQSRNLLLAWRNISGLCLIFDPSLSPHYKVVCFKNYTDCTAFLVYNSETHEWNERGESFAKNLQFRDGVYFNGGVYFVRSHHSSFGFVQDDDDDISFIADPPRISSPGKKKSYTMELNGRLHHLTLSWKPDMNLLHVFVMKENASGWSRKNLVNFNPILAKHSVNNWTAIDLLGMMRGEREEERMLLFHVPGKIMIYSFSDKIYKVVVDFRSESYFREGELQFGFKNAYGFTHTLASV